MSLLAEVVGSRDAPGMQSLGLLSYGLYVLHTRPLHNQNLQEFWTYLLAYMAPFVNVVIVDA